MPRALGGTRRSRQRTDQTSDVAAAGATSSECMMNAQSFAVRLPPLRMVVSSSSRRLIGLVPSRTRELLYPWRLARGQDGDCT